MDLVGALVGDDRLQVHHVADDRVLQADAVGAEDRRVRSARPPAPPPRWRAWPARPADAAACRRPSVGQAGSASAWAWVIAVSMSASLAWVSWKPAIGLPNCGRIFA